MCTVAACEPPGSIVFFVLFFLIRETFLSLGFNVGRGWMAKNRMGQGVGSVSHKLIEKDVFDSLDTFFNKKKVIKQIKPKKKKHMARMYV